MNEQKLFQLLKSNLFPDLKSTDEYNLTDAFSLQYSLTIELKCRHRHFDTLLIEKPKYEALIAKLNCRYINSTPNGVYSWDLHKVKEPTWFNHQMPASTQFEHYDKQVIKTVGYLHINDAKNLSNILNFKIN
jgi:hypothetical protein